MIRARQPRGYTLPELLIGMGVMVVVVAGALALLLAQLRAYKNSAGDRALQESARAALADMGMNLRRAGFGVDPWLTIDFGAVTGSPFSRISYPSGPPGGTTVSCTSTNLVACRDSTTGSDEIVFYARDPAFSRTLSGTPSGTALTLSSAVADPLLPGQILQVVCPSAADVAYVTVLSTDSVTPAKINLDTSSSGTFPFQQGKLSSGCFLQSGVMVFRVERFHYFVQTFADPQYPGGRPYLMLDKGLKRSGVAVVEPVAPDVEDVQFSYVFLNGDVVGNTGARLSDSQTSIDLGNAVNHAVPPTYDLASDDPSRMTHSPSNIRAVRISMVVRSSAYDALHSTGAYATIPAAANRAAVTTATPGYLRLLVETTEAIRNLDSRNAFLPPRTTNSGADGLNVGGG